jgi:hypothetical protein
MTHLALKGDYTNNKFLRAASSLIQYPAAGLKVIHFFTGRSRPASVFAGSGYEAVDSAVGGKMKFDRKILDQFFIASDQLIKIRPRGHVHMRGENPAWNCAGF